jgi:hypothetical protein
MVLYVLLTSDMYGDSFDVYLGRFENPRGAQRSDTRGEIQSRFVRDQQSVESFVTSSKWYEAMARN